MNQFELMKRREQILTDLGNKAFTEHTHPGVLSRMLVTQTNEAWSESTGAITLQKPPRSIQIPGVEFIINESVHSPRQARQDLNQINWGGIDPGTYKRPI